MFHQRIRTCINDFVFGLNFYTFGIVVLEMHTRPDMESERSQKNDQADEQKTAGYCSSRTTSRPTVAPIRPLSLFIGFDRSSPFRDYPDIGVERGLHENGPGTKVFSRFLDAPSLSLRVARNDGSSRRACGDVTRR